MRPGRGPAAQHLLATAPRGDQPDADLDQPRVGLGVRLNRVARQQHFTAATDGESARRADDREAGVLERHECELPAANHLADFVPRADVGDEERQPDIGASREVLAVVADHQTHEVAPLHDFDCLGNHFQPERVNCVQLAVEFEQHDSVARVP